MQYVAQTCSFVKARFNEHYRRMKKPRKIIFFIIDISNTLIFFSSHICILLGEHIIYTFKRYKNILRHELRL